MQMIQAIIRVGLLQQQSHLRWAWRSSQRSGETSVSFQQARVFCSSSTKKEMDSQNQQNKTTGDIMADSFGEGYSTRSNEEGFGGVYGGKQTLSKEEEEDKGSSHETHHEYDKSQGSEVKEKEKGRHQM